MTERELQKIGFKKEVVCPDESGMDDNYHYYTYDIAEGINLITPANDEIINEDWYVEFFDTTPSIRFKDLKDLMDVINILEKSIVQPELETTKA